MMMMMVVAMVLVIGEGGEQMFMGEGNHDFYYICCPEVMRGKDVW